MKTKLKDMEQLAVAKKHGLINGAPVKKKPSLRCYKCHTIYHYRQYPNWILRNVLFFLPIKVYFCAYCVKYRYILITDKEVLKYEPV